MNGMNRDEDEDSKSLLECVCGADFAGQREFSANVSQWMLDGELRTLST